MIRLGPPSRNDYLNASAQGNSDASASVFLLLGLLFVCWKALEARNARMGLGATKLRALLVHSTGLLYKV